MKKTLSIFCMAMICCTSFAQQKVYTLADWDIKDWDSQKGELELDVSEYKLNFNHPLPFQDMQSSWRVKADLKCGTLGTEQVFAYIGATGVPAVCGILAQGFGLWLFPIFLLVFFVPLAAATMKIMKVKNAK